MIFCILHKHETMAWVLEDLSVNYLLPGLWHVYSDELLDIFYGGDGLVFCSILMSLIIDT